MILIGNRIANKIQGSRKFCDRIVQRKVQMKQKILRAIKNT